MNDPSSDRRPAAAAAGARPQLLGLLPEELVEHLRGRGVAVRDAEARRIDAHAVAGGREGFPRARPVPRATDDPADGFVKFLFRLPAGIRRLARERRRYRLVVPLTSAVEELRRELLPVAGTQPLAQAVREYQRAMGGLAPVQRPPAVAGGLGRLVD